ncbi:MAG: DUF393 domain-containing protein [Bacteroidia bacterium]|nr:DUF393 domain-containing protein [Bacteroidia bacterium]
MKLKGTKPIVFYDGICGLCNWCVQFLLKWDKKSVFTFCSLQSKSAAKFLGDNYSTDSIVLYYNGKVYNKSTAVLNIVVLLGGLWKVAFLFKVIPKFLRDFIYDWIAVNRYRWFGKLDACKLPDKETHNRFLE